MRIPTLLALTLIIIAIILGIGLFYYRQQEVQKNKPLFIPKNIQVVNLSSNTVSITWQTDNPVTGALNYGQNLASLPIIQNDDRDQDKVKFHIVHFVSLKDLTPQTKYYFQIKSGAYLFPDKPLEFTTARLLSQKATQNLGSPIRGTLLENSTTPIDEALIVLKADGATPLATYTSTAGNFILPLTDLRTNDLANFFPIGQNLNATLEISRSSNVSHIKIILPLDSQSLPPIILGKDQDLRQLIATNAARLKEASIPSSPKNKFDLNGDGKVNALDVAIVLENLGNNPRDRRADFNGDGVVDQKDINLIEKALQ